MGCWNGTCGITQLPIESGDLVVGLLIAKHRYENTANGYCYIDNMYFPISLPFKGRYDDYGSMEDVEAVGTEIVISNLTIDEQRWQKRYGWRDLQKLDITTFNNVLDNIEYVLYETKIYPKEKQLPVGLWMVHEEVYNVLLNPLAESWEKEHNLRKVLTKQIESIERFEISDKLFEQLQDDKEFKNYTKEELEIILNLKAKRVVYLPSPYSRNALNKFLSLVIKDDKVKNSFIDLQMLAVSMSQLRKGFVPQTGMGSQRDELEAYEQLLKVQQNFIENRYEERKEYE